MAPRRTRSHSLSSSALNSRIKDGVRTSSRSRREAAAAKTVQAATMGSRVTKGSKHATRSRAITSEVPKEALETVYEGPEDAEVSSDESDEIDWDVFTAKRDAALAGIQQDNKRELRQSRLGIRHDPAPREESLSSYENDASEAVVEDTKDDSNEAEEAESSDEESVKTVKAKAGLTNRERLRRIKQKLGKAAGEGNWQLIAGSPEKPKRKPSNTSKTPKTSKPLSSSRSRPPVTDDDFERRRKEAARDAQIRKRTETRKEGRHVSFEVEVSPEHEAETQLREDAERQAELEAQSMALEKAAEEEAAEEQRTLVARQQAWVQQQENERKLAAILAARNEAMWRREEEHLWHLGMRGPCSGRQMAAAMAASHRLAPVNTVAVPEPTSTSEATAWLGWTKAEILKLIVIAKAATVVDVQAVSEQLGKNEEAVEDMLEMIESSIEALKAQKRMQNLRDEVFPEAENSDPCLSDSELEDQVSLAL